MQRAIVTGTGIITALGTGAAAHLDALRKGRTGIGRARHLDSRYADSLPFAEVSLSTEELFDTVRPKETKGITRTELLALAALSEAIAQAGLTAAEVSSPRTAFISATTVGGMVQTEALHRDSNSTGTGTEYIHSYRNGDHTIRIAGMLGLKGPTATLSTACSSSANAIMLGARLIRSGLADRAIVGGTDSLARYTVNGFNALQILSDAPCRPFDRDRKGLTLGEGAAYLVLEGEGLAKGMPPIGEVRGWGNANDAYHASSMSPDAVGAVLAMNGALSLAGTQPSEVSHVNAHGTGTPNNDTVEMEGLRRVFSDGIPPFVSTKSYTGHTLAAAGAVEAVLALVSIAQGEIYPSLHFSRGDDGAPAAPSTSLLRAPVRHVLSNSFGFGGNCTSLLLSAV